MQTILFHDTIFGPIHSRRLGTSLGVNLMPRDGKICSFDCLYCEAGLNAQGPGKAGLPTAVEVKEKLEEKLRNMSEAGERLDVITFSGNGEPTLHPQFEEITDSVIDLRNRYFPQVKISVLSNATQLHREDVCRALMKVDNNILKLDSAIDRTAKILDQPSSPSYSIEKVVRQMAMFGKQCIVQTMMLTGHYLGERIDNTTPKELEALSKAYKAIGPAEVMLYSIDRKTPVETLEKVSLEQLEKIADRFRNEGIKVQVN